MLRIILAALAALFMLAASSQGAPQARKAPISVSDLAAQKRQIQAEDDKAIKKISALVRLAQPRKGLAYARKVASSIVRASRAFHMDPYLIAATGYCESEFSMASRPYIGIMQVSRALARDYARRGHKYDIHSIDGNIRLGTHVLASHAGLTRSSAPSRGLYASRGGYSTRSLSYALGRYSGTSARSSYTTKVFRSYGRIKNGTPDTWRSHLRKGRMLWR